MYTVAKPITPGELQTRDILDHLGLPTNVAFSKTYKVNILANNRVHTKMKCVLN